MKALTFCLLALFLVFNGCTRKSESDLWDVAAKSIKEGKIQEAVSAYEQLLKEYPQGENAPAALFELGKIYQGRLLPNMSEADAYGKAIEYYRRLADNHPKHKDAPNALFMIGFIQANYIAKYDDATVTFNAFLQKYPQHGLTASVQDELNNMGKSPEEILETTLQAHGAKKK